MCAAVGVEVTGHGLRPRTHLPQGCGHRQRFEKQRLACAYPRGTIVAMTVEPLRTVRDHLSEFVDRAEREHERVVVTRNGRPAAVLIGYDDLAGLEETLDILSDPEALGDIRQAEAEVARGEGTRGVDAVRALHPLV